jgi:hypothetical protein
LATSPDFQSFFIPSNSQWRKDSVDLSAYANVGQLQIAFRNIGDWGNCLYLDNINIGSMANQPELEPMKRSVFPNPVGPGSTLQVKGSSFDTAKLFDSNGKEIYRFDAKQNLFIPPHIRAGSYLLQLRNEKLISNLPIIIVE